MNPEKNGKLKLTKTPTYGNRKLTTKTQTVVTDLLDLEDYLRNSAQKLTNDSDKAQDLFQDTMVRIITNQDKYNPGTNFKARCYTIMKNIFINGYRKKARRNELPDQTPNSFYINSGKTVVENKGKTNLGYDELMRLVNKLPEDFKVAFMMAYEGYKYEEIAEELGEPLGTIKSRIFFARKKLQKMYEQLFTQNKSVKKKRYRSKENAQNPERLGISTVKNIIDLSDDELEIFISGFSETTKKIIILTHGRLGISTIASTLKMSKSDVQGHLASALKKL